MTILNFSNFKINLRFYLGEMPSKESNGIANSLDPDQTAPLGEV